MTPKPDRRGVVASSLVELGKLRDPSWVFDLDRNRILWANAGAVELWQAPTTDALYERDFADGMSPATKTRLASYVPRFEAGLTVTEVWTFYPQGRSVTVRCTCSGVRLDDGATAMLVQADREVSEDDQVLRGIEALRHTTVMIRLVTLDGDVLEANPAAVRAYGPSTTKPWWAAYDDTQAASAIVEAVSSGRPYSGELQVHTTEGPRHHGIDATPTHDPVTGRAAVLLNEKDITRRVEAERRLQQGLERDVASRTWALREANAALAAREAFVSTVFDAVDSLLIVTRPDGSIVRTNAAVRKLIGDVEAGKDGCGALGWTKGETCGFRVSPNVVYPSTSEVEVVARDGSTRRVAWAHTALRDDDGAVRYLIGAGVDVTERRELQLRLQLADKLTLLGELAASVAHEVNNPLTTLRANLELVRESIEEPELGALPPSELSACLADCAGAVERIRVVVSDLRTAVRDGEGSADDPVDINAVVAFATELTRPQIEACAALHLDLGRVPRVTGSEARLGQVVTNLLINAVQAIGPGKAGAHSVTVRTWFDDDGVSLEVADTGGGVPEAIARRVFEPFFTTKRADAGMGLGLSICKRIVAEHGGRLSVRNEDGGAVFRVVLPRAGRRQSGTVARAVIDSRAIPEGLRILIVDDEKPIREALRRVFRQHDVVLAGSGNEGLEVVRAQPPFDVIFCDLVMADGSGADFFEGLDEVAPEQRDHVVFMTGGAFGGHMRDLLDRYRKQTLRKPLDLPTIRSALIDVLDRTAAKAGAPRDSAAGED